MLKILHIPVHATYIQNELHISKIKIRTVRGSSGELQGGTKCTTTSASSEELSLFLASICFKISYGYDWRLSPHLLSKRLISFLEGLQCNATDVPRNEKGAIIIAHSMGG